MSDSVRTRLILASRSPRRRDLLVQAGFPPDVIVPADADETAHAGELPRALVGRLATLKATTVATDYPDDFVLGADTVVALGRRVLPKPDDAAGAVRALRMLSGRRHRVYGGICLLPPKGAKPRVRIVHTHVQFQRLHDDDIDAYVAGGEWQDKAGGYAIQGNAARFIVRINGSHTNVVGLALYETVALLRGNGYCP